MSSLIISRSILSKNFKGYVQLLIFALFLPLILRSQTIKGTLPTTRTEKEVKALLELLDKDELSKVPELFFGLDNVYDRELADLIVYINNRTNSPEFNNHARIALLKKGKITDALFGEKYVYVMVFLSEDANATDSISDEYLKEEKIYKNTKKCSDGKPPEITKEQTITKKPSDPLLISQSSLDWRPGSGEFILFAAMRTLASIFAGTAYSPSEKPEKVSDVVNVPLKMLEVGCHEKTRLFFGMQKIALAENSLNRLTVLDEKKNIRHLATFGNYSRSLITSSIGIMGTIIPKDDKTGTDERTPLEAFIFVHRYLKRPQIPAPRHHIASSISVLKPVSVSFVVGTKISKPLLDDIFVGLSIGHVVSTIGFIGGLNWRTITTVKDGVSTTIRKAYLSVGVNIML